MRSCYFKTGLNDRGCVDVFHHCCHYIAVMSERSTHDATLIDVDYKSRWIFEKEDSGDVLDLL